MTSPASRKAVEEPNHRRGAAVTQHLLAVALDLIATRGSDTSIDDIAREAGVNKTTVYRRWPDTSSLLADAVRAHAAAAIPLVASGDVRADLVRLCLDVVSNLESPIGRALHGLGNSAGGVELDDRRRSFWAERLDSATTLLAPLATTHSSAELTDTAMERLVGPLHFRINERRLTVDQAYIERLVDHFLAGLGSASPTQP